VKDSEEQVHNMEQQEALAENPAATDQQAQGQGPPSQEKTVEILVL